MFPLRCGSAFVHPMPLVRHQRSLGVHAARPHSGAHRAEGRKQQLCAVRAADDGRASDQHAGEQFALVRFLNHQQCEEGLRRFVQVRGVKRRSALVGLQKLSASDDEVTKKAVTLRRFAGPRRHENTATKTRKHEEAKMLQARCLEDTKTRRREDASGSGFRGSAESHEPSALSPQTFHHPAMVLAGPRVRLWRALAIGVQSQT
jgi:hypothetical protein